jgi:oligopeptide transport system substrate-binding protein
MKKKISIIFALLFVASMVLTACAQPAQEVVKTVIVTKEVMVEGEQVIVTEIVEVMVTAEPEEEAVPEEQPVTFYGNWGTEPPTMDPALTEDTTSVTGVENMFVGLTVLTESGEVEPYLATDWEVGEDADGNPTYTFNLRDDIPWVKYDPISGETSQEVDEDGNPRFVNANDVVYGVKRTLDPETASPYSYILYGIIKNALEVNTGEEGFTLDDVGVVALDDTTVEFTLASPAPFFPSIASMWVLKPQPAWAIDEWGIKWTEAGLIVTNGPYTMEEWIHGGELNMIRNTLFPEGVFELGNIDRSQMVMIVEISTAFALYENDELDTSEVPLPEMDRVRADPVLSEELYIAPDSCTYYYGFTNNKPPFDDVRVRRAFSAAIDRQSLIDNVTKGGQIPATSFAPPGIFGAPPPGEVGQGTDAELAKAQLQEYLDENGMTVDDFNAMGITMMHNTSESHAIIAAAAQQMWKDTLGVDVQVENQEWKVYLDTVSNTTPIEDMPHIWRLGWCADYADENNWIHAVFNATEGDNNLRRGCQDDNCGDIVDSEFDELTKAAQVETDPDARAALYRQAEEILSGEEVAYAPIYHYTWVYVTKPWLEREYSLIAGQQLWKWNIDQEAQSAGQ